MPSEAEVAAIVADVRNRLAHAAKKGVHLRVVREKLEDDWLYVVVEPAQPGVRALDHAEAMSEIERELRRQGTEHVLLLPTLED